MNFAAWILFIALLIAFASAGIIPEEEYLPPVLEDEQIAAEQPLEESAALAKDGYRYKTVRKLRHRRDVSELFAQGTLADDGYHYYAPKPAGASPKIAQEYLPPVVNEATENKEVREAPQVSNKYLPPPTAEEVTEVKEITKSPEISREYLPPTEAAATLDLPQFAASEELPSLDDDAVIVEGPGPDEPTILADDGYHYRRIRYRRDVSEIAPATSGYSYEPPADDAEEIKPPTELKEAIAEPTEENQEIVKEYLPPTAEIKAAPETPSDETAKLSEDGYRYKTIRKLKYRQRRDVSEIGSTEKEDKAEEAPTSEEKDSVLDPTAASIEYLPPVAEVKESPEVPSETAELAEDGYRYKTIRKLKYRQRRDVSHILSPESATLDKDGYHYRVPEPSKVISKVSKEYLPPFEELRELSDEPKEVEPTEASVVTEASPVTTESTTMVMVTEAAPIVTESTTVVTEAPLTTAVPTVSNEYLPPVEEVPKVKEVTEAPSTTPAPTVSNEYLPPIEEVPQVKEASEIPQETAILAKDGYHYKVGKRFRFRRDVSHIFSPSNGYAYDAPADINEAANIYLPPVEVKEAVESTQAPQVSSEYLPPAAESKDDAEIIEAPEESAILADDGYHYKTVRRLKYRNRRDASESASPQAYFYPTPADEEETARLADDGYRYKTVRRLRYRHRRDVSELAPQVAESAILAEDGYHYKAPAAAVKTSSEYLPPVESDAAIVEALVIEPTIAPEAPQALSEYLPPSEESAPKEVSNEYLPPSEETRSNHIAEPPQDSAVLADDGYRYKTVRRIRYRHRRDVSEIVAPQAEGYAYDAPIDVQPQEIQYLPPVEEAAQVKEAIDTAPLADDGYRYKTVRRIRYRHRV